MKGLIKTHFSTILEKRKTPKYIFHARLPFHRLAEGPSSAGPDQAGRHVAAKQQDVNGGHHAVQINLQRNNYKHLQAGFLKKA